MTDALWGGRTQDAIALVTRAAEASPIGVALLQPEADRLFRQLMQNLCTGDDTALTSALIWQGSDSEGTLVEACLQAQALGWPDPRLRLRIAENAVGLLDNCKMYEGMHARGAQARLLRGLIELEEPLLSIKDASLVSGVLESYGLCLPRLLKTQAAGAARADDAELAGLASRSLIRVLGARQDLKAEERSAAVCLLSELVRREPPPSSYLGRCAELLLQEMHSGHAKALAYLHAHEGLAALEGDEALLAAFKTLRQHRIVAQARPRAVRETFYEALGSAARPPPPRPQTAPGASAPSAGEEQGLERRGAEGAGPGQLLLEGLEGPGDAPEPEAPASA